MLYGVTGHHKLEAAMKTKTASFGGVVAGTHSRTHVLLVLDPRLYDPKWKFAGGGIELYETVKQAGARETKEESGVKILPRAFREAFPPQRDKHFVSVWVPTWKLFSHAKRGQSGEIPRVVTFAEAITLPNFLEQHRAFLAFLYENVTKRTKES